MTTPFPKSPTFMTIDEPFRMEGDTFDLEGEGEIPAALDGWFYRVGPACGELRFMPPPATDTAHGSKAAIDSHQSRLSCDSDLWPSSLA
jgi:hypothetical protein